MAVNGGNIEIGVGLKYDKSSSNDFIKDLNKIASMTQKEFMEIHPKLSVKEAETELKKLKDTANDLKLAVQRSLNMETGVINIQKLNAQLKNIDVSRIKQAGAQGEIAFNKMYKAALTTHNQVKKVQTTLDKMGTTLANTIKWGISSSIMNNFTGAVQQAYGYVKNLDTALNDIRIVTGKSSEEMERFAVQANNAAKALGKTTNDYTKASLIYYQQGLSDEETAARTDVTLKAANVTGQTASEVSEQLTAVWNGYKVSAQETELYIDKLAKVAADTAADLEELSTGMSKVASAANIMGVDVDQLNAQLATIISVTREAPETIGTSLKTVYARMATIKAGGIDEEDGATLTSYTEKMSQLGINVLDSNNNLRDMGEVIEEIGGKWANMTREQQVSLAQTIAGTRQYSRMMSLFDNWDMYEKTLNTSMNAQGTLQKQQDIYMDSMEAHLNTLTAQWEDLYDSILDENGLKTLIDGFTDVLTVITKIVDSIGGSGGLLALVGAVGGSLLGKGLASDVTRKMGERFQAAAYQRTMEDRIAGTNEDGSQKYTTTAQRSMTKMTAEYAQYYKVLSEEQIKMAEQSVALTGELENQKVLLQEKIKLQNESIKKQEEELNKAKSQLVTDKATKGKWESILQSNEKGGQDYKQMQSSLVKAREAAQSKGLSNSAIYNLDFSKSFNEEEIKRITQELEKFSNTADQLIKPSTIKNMEIFGKELNNLTGDGKKGKGLLEDYAKKGFLSTEEVEKYKNALNELASSNDKAAVKKEKLKQIITEVNNKVSENASAYKNAYKSITEWQAKVKQAKDRIQELEKAIKDGNGDVEKQTKELEKAKKELQEYEESLKTVKQQQGSIFKDNAVTQAAISGSIGNITKGFGDLASSVGSVTMGVFSLKSGFDTLANSDLSWGERLSGFILSMSMSLPTLMGGISSLTSSISNIHKGFSTLLPLLVEYSIATEQISIQEAASAAATALDIKADEAKAIITREITEEEALRILTEKGLLTAEIEKGIAEEQTTATEVLAGIVREKTCAQLIKETGLTGLLTIAKERLNKAIEKNIILSKLGITSLKSLAASVGVIAAAIAAAVAVIALYIGHEKKLAQASANRAKAQAEEANKTLEANKKLKEQADELNKTLKENKDNYTDSQLADYRQQVYDLCQQYGDEENAIRSLTASYEDLQNIMNEVSSKGAAELGASAERAKNANIQAAALQYRADNSTKNSFKSLGYNLISNIGGLAAGGMVGPGGFGAAIALNQNKSDKYYEEINSGFNLSSFGKKDTKAKQDFKGLGINISEHGYMNIEELVKVASTNREELDKLLLQYSNAKWAADIQKTLETYSDQIEAATEAYKTEKEQVSKSIIDATVGSEPIENAGDYEKQLNVITNRFITETDYYETEEEARKAAREYLKAYSEEFSNYDNIAQIAERLAPAFQNSTKEDIAKELTSYNQAEIDLIVGFSDSTGQGYKSIKDLLEDKKDELKVLESSEVAVKTKAVLESDLSKGIPEEQVNSLYEGGVFENVSGISQEEFLRKSTANQLTILQNYYQQYSAYSKEHLEEMQKDLEKEQETTSAFIQSREALINKSNDRIANLEAKRDSTFIASTNTSEAEKVRLEAVGKDIAELYAQIKEDGEVTAEEQANVLDQLENKHFYYTRSQLENLLNTYSEVDKEIDAEKDNLAKWEAEANAARTKVAGLEAQIAELKNGTEDLDVQIKIQIDSEITKAALSDVKDLESSYKNLTSIMDEYNETGALSLNNLEQLLTMDDKYIASLDIQNGQMVMNEQAMQNQTMAYLDLLEATAYDEAMNELDAIAKGEATDAAWESVEANKAAAEGARAAGEAALAGSEGWEQYWASLEKARAADAKDSEATKNVEQALKNRLLMIQGMRDRIKSQGMAGLSGGSGSSAGSSGSESKKEAEHLDYLEREKDIYRTINAEISDIENTLDRIRKVDEHSWGASAQVAIEKESKELDALLKKYEQKKAMQEKDLGSRRYQLEQRGIQFTADGSAMTNAEEWLDKKYAEYNAMVDKYNSMSAEEQEAYKEQLDKFKQDIDDVEKAMKDYESGFSDYQSTLNTLLEKHYEQIELAVKKFNNKINVELDLDNAKKTWEDFWYDVVQDVDDNDFIGKFEKSITRMKDLLKGDSGMGIIGDITSHLNETIAEVNKQIAGAANGGGDSMFGDDTALSKETLLQWRDSLIQYVTEAKQQLDALADNYLKVLDSAQDKIDEQIKGLESITNHLDHNIKLIEMVSGTKAYDAFNKQYEKTYETNLKTIETQRMSKDYWADQMKHYKKLMDSVDKNSKAYKTYSEAYKKSVENYRQAVNDLDAAVENALEKLEEWHQKQLEEIQDKLEKGLTGTDVGLDTVEKEWQLINKWADQYYDNVERSINTEEYAHYLEQVANNTELSVESQKKLNEFRDEELKKLKEKENLTQYDIDESKARLAILQQEIALQDAQQQKNKMRLRRDSQGNYTYQYVGDDAAVEDAESKMFTAKKEWYALVKQRLKDVTEYSMELAKQQAELLKEIDEAEKNGETEKANLLRNLYNRNAQEIAKFGKEVEKNQKDIYSGLNAYFSDVQNNQMIPQFESTAYQMAERFGEASAEVQKSISGAMTEVTQLLEDYGQRTKEILEQAGIDYRNMVENGVDPTTDALEDLVETNEDLADELDKVNETLREQEKELETMEDLYNNLKEAAVKAIDEANKALETLSKTAIESLKDVEAAIKTVNDARNQSYNSSDGTSTNNDNNPADGSGSGSDTTGEDKKTKIVNKPIKVYYRYLETTPDGGDRYGIYLGDSKKYQGSFVTPKTQNTPDRILAYLRGQYPSPKYDVVGRFKTGGYTGDWSDGSPLLDNGKLAVLHQKELVLNASDTQNLLDTVETLRNLQFDRLIENLNISANTPYELLSDLDRQIDAIQTTIAAQSPTFTGDVIINADFPNATDMDEIYQAFVELENVGMQAIYSNSPLQSMSIISGGGIYDRNYK